MNNAIQNEKGFTLIEMLVVLVIFTIICSSVLFFTTEKLTNYTNEQFIDQTELLIRLAQAKAIETKSNYEFQVFNCRRITVRNFSQRDEVLFDQELPAGIEIFLSTTHSKILFNNSGNIRSSGTIMYHFNNYAYHFTINMGKGRQILKNVIETPDRINSCGYASSSSNLIFSNVNIDSDHL
ncbi:competence type IV pilus minor pilin ComGD [Solibacillus daqui]|uniref:competence type IV pilus minor pilin ComGD n=1 Tax=Solibacillus daqui TaxID=2912187 RepID=UPI0023654FE4|nr:competence type IV pilus minor pilin ComGD [Solibacillus daqui]